jgi:uncharacterized protein YcbX
MTIIGTVDQLWRFPFKSMGGEQLDHCVVGTRGVVGDRAWAVRDEGAGEIRGAKKIPALLQCTARFVEEPREGLVPAVEITLPDGECFRSDDADAARRLSSFLGRSVTVWPIQPATNLDHYQRGRPDSTDLMEELRQIFGRLPDEPLPDISSFPPEVMRYAAPPGTYFDLSPLHVLTTSSLRAVAARTPGATVDVRRFRPNVLIEPTDKREALPESEWHGKRLRIGSVEARIEMDTVRCVMPTLPQADLPKEPAILRTIVREMGQGLGVYASVVSPGSVRVGEAVELLY